MRIGFTGTRRGMTAAQENGLRWLVHIEYAPSEFHHGSCQGSDVQAARLVRRLRPECCIVCHPGPDDDPCQQESGVDSERLPGKTHFARNRDIVVASDLLIATPVDPKPSAAGGTWYTIRYAVKKGVRCWIIWPNGDLELAKKGM